MTLGKAILEALDANRGGPITAKAVYGLVLNDAVPEPTLSEVEGELRTLEQRREVVGVRDEDRGVVYQITASGRARALS